MSSEQGAPPVVRRVILKISGESLKGQQPFGLSTPFLEQLAHEVQPVIQAGVELGIVVGGGNFFRGARQEGHRFSRVTGDQLGMLATVINALALADVFKQQGIRAVTMSAIAIEGIVERYSYLSAGDYLSQGQVVIFAAGTGNPFVTTDTALCLRGVELNADLILKATQVDGVYSDDPMVEQGAKFYPRLSYDEAIQQGLRVMDFGAFSLGREHGLKLVVFNINRSGALLRIMQGLPEGTRIE